MPEDIFRIGMYVVTWLELKWPEIDTAGIDMRHAAKYNAERLRELLATLPAREAKEK